MARMMALKRTAFFTLGGLVIAVVGLRGAQNVPPTPASDIEATIRLREMRHHFAQVMVVNEAVIRGDLAGVRAPATFLATMTPPPGITAGAVPYFDELRRAARHAAEATSLPAAARETAAMLSQCGECHRASAVRPSPAIPGKADLGGVVGHMLEHQRATDEMLLGLVLPSGSEWEHGAARLRTANLASGELPSDPKLTKEIAVAETRVHKLADQAEAARNSLDRSLVYTQLLTTCAQCHGLHGRVWGPRGTF
jgi:cytochrome c553